MIFLVEAVVVPVLAPVLLFFIASWLPCTIEDESEAIALMGGKEGADDDAPRPPPPAPATFPLLLLELF